MSNGVFNFNFLALVFFEILGGSQMSVFLRYAVAGGVAVRCACVALRRVARCLRDNGNHALCIIMSYGRTWSVEHC